MRRLFTLGVFLASACDGGGGDSKSHASGPPLTTILAPGTGMPSPTPLWEPRAGTLYGDGTGAKLILDAIEIDGRTAYLSARPGDPGPLGAHRDWEYFSSTPEGLYLLGNVRDGLLPRPILVVPATVLAGMQWEVDPGDGGETAICSASVEGTLASATGAESRIWFLYCKRDWAYGDDGSPITFALKLVEGLGPANSTVLPLDPSPPPAERPPTIELTAVSGGQPLLEQTFAISVGALVNPGRDGESIRLIIVGSSAGFSQGGVEGSAVNAWLPSDSRGCVLFDGEKFREPMDAGRFTNSDVVYRACPKPGQAVVRPDGAVDTVLGTETCIGGAQFIGDMSMRVCSPYSPLAGIYPGPDRTQAVGGGGANYVAGDLHLPIDPKLPMLDNVRPLGALGQGDLSVYPEAGTGVLRIGIDGGTATLDHDEFRNRRPGTRTFQVSTKRTVEGRDDLHMMPNGYIERLHFGEGGLRVEPLGQVDLPKGHWLVGAIEHAGKLLVFTQGDFKGYDIQLVRRTDLDGITHIEIDNLTKPDFGNVYLFTAPLPAPTAPVELPPARRTVTLTPSGDDAWICSASRERPGLSGWSMGGGAVPDTLTPARETLAAGDACVLVVRDAPHESGPPAITGEEPPPRVWSTVGSIPGLGRTYLPFEAAMIPDLQIDGPAAALTGGGFVTQTTRFSSAGTPTGPVRPIAGWAIQVGYADTAGNGLWLIAHGETQNCTHLPCRWIALNAAEGTRAFDLPEGATPENEPLCAGCVQGGGLLLNGGVMDPQGVIHEHPAPQAPMAGRALHPKGALADGTVCGYVGAEGAATPDAFGCAAPDGTLREKPFAEAGPFVPFVASWAVSKDGVFYIADLEIEPLKGIFGGNVGRFDPNTLETTVLTFVDGVGPRYTWSHDTDGTLYAAVAFTDPNVPAFNVAKVYRMEGVAPVEVPLPAGFVTPDLFRVVPQPDVFLVATHGDLVLGEADFLRVLR